MISRLVLSALLATTYTVNGQERKSVMGLPGKCPTPAAEGWEFERAKLRGPWRTVYSPDMDEGLHGDESTTSIRACIGTQFQFLPKYDAIKYSTGRMSGFQPYLYPAEKGPEGSQVRGSRRYVIDDSKLLLPNKDDSTGKTYRNLDVKKPFESAPLRLYGTSSEGSEQYDVLYTYRCNQHVVNVDNASPAETKYINKLIQKIALQIVDSEVEKFQQSEKKTQDGLFMDYMNRLRKTIDKTPQLGADPKQLQADWDEFIAFDPEAYTTLVGDLGEWERLRYLLVHVTEVDQLTAALLAANVQEEKFDLDVQIHVRESDELRTNQWWVDRFPELLKGLETLVPGFDFSQTHYKITHQLEQCPAGDLNAEPTTVGALNNKKALQMKENLGKLVEQEEQIRHDLSKAKEHKEAVDWIKMVTEFSAQELQYWKEDFMGTGPAVGSEMEDL